MIQIISLTPNVVVPDLYHLMYSGRINTLTMEIEMFTNNGVYLYPATNAWTANTFVRSNYRMYMPSDVMNFWDYQVFTSVINNNNYTNNVCGIPQKNTGYFEIGAR